MRLAANSGIWTLGCTALLVLLPATAALAQDNTANRRTFSSGYRFVEMTGEELFANVCQGCHMPDAAGAAGGGAYPAPPAHQNPAARGPPTDLLDHGRPGMGATREPIRRPVRAMATPRPRR